MGFDVLDGVAPSFCSAFPELGADEKSDDWPSNDIPPNTPAGLSLDFKEGVGVVLGILEEPEPLRPENAAF